MLGKRSSCSSVKCSDKFQKVRKAISLDTKLAILAIAQHWAVEWKGTQDDTPHHSGVSLTADTFWDFENGVQKITDNDPNC